MRTFLCAAAAAATAGLISMAPAQAAPSHWECMGGYVACGSSHSAARSTYNYRSQGRVYAERAAHRLSSRTSRSHYSAQHAEPGNKLVQKAVAEKQPAKVVEVASRSGRHAQSGMASYYGSESGSQTASGARFNPGAMTAAHRSLPFGTKVRVTNKRNGRSVVVTINDRGPFIRGRIIDLSTGAAGVIGMRSSGVAPVSIEVLGRNG
jgi:rare lipoprotein A